MRPLISIIVPIFQVKLYLDRCVESICNQIYSHLEIILVDDGSPDNCPAMCDAWAEKDPRIKVIHKQNGGLSDARNAGLTVASGACIAFVDGDDYVEATYIEDMLACMERTKADIVECGVLYVDKNAQVLRTRSVPVELTLNRTEALKKLILEDGVYQTVWNKLYRREVIMGLSFEVGRHHEDDFWTYQVFDRSNHMTVLPNLLYNYLQHKNSIMGNGYTLKRLDGLEARYRRMQYLQKYEELAALTRQQLLMDCMWHYQCTLKYLRKKDQKQALIFIKEIIKSIAPMSREQLTLNMKYKLWFCLFHIAPGLVARIRNALRIGI